jgi:ligand-binding sensor protein
MMIDVMMMMMMSESSKNAKFTGYCNKVKSHAREKTNSQARAMPAVI